MSYFNQGLIGGKKVGTKTSGRKTGSGGLTKKGRILAKEDSPHPTFRAGAKLGGKR